MQEKIALDIVLLLPKDMQDLCIRIDRGSERSKEVSFEDGYNPHITLAMGVVRMSDIPAITKKIDELAESEHTLALSFTGFHEGKSSWLEIAKTESLFQLHQKINAIVKEFSSYDATTESFYEYEINTPQRSLVEWVNNFPIGASDDAYDPHISLGKEHAYKPDFPVDFTVNTIGMFHLGWHGTCKHELARFTLGT